ncbi:hypothetical protein INS49_011902 [Diaporthe citri]|uniref:uncharacterized protein n=1 Tax=Diaporthe citri TaxID=83186 RepID=UPI001C80ED0F|nr:uncharacterized protein INS49_011902 [Diaporthe citri]KAG6360835.1 hypothetical protein INS49_011902 [Diaporthe citri]
MYDQLLETPKLIEYHEIQSGAPDALEKLRDAVFVACPFQRFGFNTFCIWSFELIMHDVMELEQLVFSSLERAFHSNN